MSFLARAEKRLGRFAVPGLLRILAGFTVAAYVLSVFHPGSLEFWKLDPERIKHGEVWRLVSYIFLPQFGGPLGLLCFIFLQFWIGDALERVWGAFRLNVFFLVGMLGTTIGAFFFGATFSSFLLFSSVFFAFARYFGETVIHVFYILPVKIQWIAWGNAAVLLLVFLFGGWDTRLAVLLGLANYLSFFGHAIFLDARHRHHALMRRFKFMADLRAGASETIHCCKTCGCTEISHPDQEFRVSAEGDEYCLDHLPRRPDR